MTVARTELNRRLKGERHAKRMAKQDSKRPMSVTSDVMGRGDIAVPRGTARAARRKHLTVLYTKRQAAAALAG